MIWMIDVNAPAPQVIAGLTTFTPSIPKFYWDVDSQEQGIKNLCITIEKTIEFLNQVADQVNIDTAAITELQEQFKKFMESGFDDYYREQIERWFNENAFNIYKLTAKQVFFGLTEDGYFCAYVPDSWKEITFDMGANYGTYTYGRIILRYETDGSGVIDNTSYGEYGEPEIYKALLDRVKTIEQTLYTVLEAKE